MTDPLEEWRLPSAARKGRGAIGNPDGRFERHHRVAIDDGWERQGIDDATSDDGDPPPLATTVSLDKTRTIIARNDSPDVPFEQSINPYRGCEHGCIYCYARPTHSYLGHSAGLDFETKLYAKVNAAELLERELASPRYVPKVIALGTVTDPTAAG